MIARNHAASAATITVIVPNWNCAPWLTEAMASLLGQSSPPEQIIVIDDGSTDNSVELLRAMAAKHPEIVLLQAERGGVSAARNRGLEIASGDFIYFMDADDFVGNTLFADFRNALVQHPEMEMFCFGAKMFTDLPVEQRDYQLFHQRRISGAFAGGSATLRKMIANQSAHRVLWSSIVSRALIKRVGVQFLPIQNHEDAPYMFALYMQANTVVLSSESYYFKRFMVTSLSQRKATFSWVENYFIARGNSESFMQQWGLPADESLLDRYYEPVMYGCLIEMRKNNIEVPQAWRVTIDQLIRKVTGESRRMKLQWYYPTLYNGLKASRSLLARYTGKR
ncbi:glycosyltransferase family 2 protein [Pantoea sp. NPDC088449]|uniref:Heptose III glucuronosyltransferase n=1 Tax=Candidatus Pantoea floridensis TaxID=1938870 RepID=A0A286BNE1_9GAMM|nr:glycosyltransferase [Pantoea floridensis]PIF22637.1 heptose III glucuronosyltransferase [Enterobacteriaceae bacterium JKS000233]SOD35650.1 heptose III glucuronosyltransferase [Pantoea floridensis]